MSAEPTWKTIVEAFDGKDKSAARELQLSLLEHVRFYGPNVPANAQKAVQPIKNCKPWRSVRKARSVCQNENTSVDLDQLRHLEETMRLELVSLIDTLVPQVRIARQDGANACRNHGREALKTSRHHVYDAYHELL